MFFFRLSKYLFVVMLVWLLRVLGLVEVFGDVVFGGFLVWVGEDFFGVGDFY